MVILSCLNSVASQALLHECSPPSLKQPCIEQRQSPEEPVVTASGFNTDVADIPKRWNSLTEQEKYNFYCNHFIPEPRAGLNI